MDLFYIFFLFQCIIFKGCDYVQIKELKKLIEKNQFNFKKKFGQNFIIDENIIN